MPTIFAGYEQMASIMYWLIVHYAERPLKQISGGGDKQYLNEVIRLHSPIWIIMRRPKDDVCVENYVLPKDCVIITSPRLMARNPNYFPEPGSFRPETNPSTLSPSSRSAMARGCARASASYAQNVCLAPRTRGQAANHLRCADGQIASDQRQRHADGAARSQPHVM
jgi:cytochrome P450